MNIHFVLDSIPHVPLDNHNSTTTATRQLPDLVLRASKSVLPQLVARIYAISLHNVLNTKHRFQIKSTGEVEPNDIELTKWMLPDFQLVYKYPNLGATFDSVGSIGWYIPTKLIAQG